MTRRITVVMPAYNAGKTPLQDDHKIYPRVCQRDTAYPIWKQSF